MLSVGYRIPQKNILLSTGTPKQKVDMLSAARMLQKKGYKLFATGGSSKFLTENGVENTRVYWPSEPDMHPQALEMLHRKEIDMVVNIPKNLTAGELDNGYRIRRAAIDLKRTCQTCIRYRPQYSADNECTSGKCVYQCLLHHDTGRFGYQGLGRI